MWVEGEKEEKKTKSERWKKIVGEGRRKHRGRGTRMKNRKRKAKGQK